MKLGRITDVASRAERLHDEQHVIQNELWDAQRQSVAAAGYYSELKDKLESLPPDTDALERALLESQINQAAAEYQWAQDSLAQAEARQRDLDNRIAEVTSDAQEYLHSVEGNIEAARQASVASSYGSSAISHLIEGFQHNKGLAERVLQLFGSSSGTDGSRLLGKSAALDESIIHIRGNEVSRHVDFLPHTSQGFHTYTINGQSRYCFNAPIETGRHLNYHQGKAFPGFGGTCGLVSCVNVARLAGKSITEADAIAVATSHNLCEVVSGHRGMSGGTYYEQRQQILALLGIDSYIDWDLSAENIASAVESGRGVIARVDAGVFWNDSRFSCGGHAITVTSVERDTSGNITAFYVCDSGSTPDDYARRVDVSQFSSSLLGPLNVTSGIIR